MTTTYNGYDKRVTLNLALHSAVAAQNPDLLAALQKLPDLGWDVTKLPQADIEQIYAEFSPELEKSIKDEFEADPAYLIDLKHSEGVCPLCGHVGIRWVFRIANHQGGKSVECGSECIIQHGLHVKGYETAEHARKALESAIRQRIKEITIKAWHDEYGFEATHFTPLYEALKTIRKTYKLDYWVRNKAYYMAQDLRKLDRFYSKHGWLGTEKRWSEWTRLVKFARTHNEDYAAVTPSPKEWVAKPKTEKTAAVVTPPVVDNDPSQQMALWS